MKKKIVFLTALAGMVLVITGCSSVQSADSSKFNGQKITASGTGVAHITAYTSGLYFLWMPLITGSAEDPNSIVFGEDACNVNAVTKMVTLKSKDLKATQTVDLVSARNSCGLPIPIPYLFYWRTVTVSGNAVK